MPTAPGPRANPVCVGGTWAGGVARSATGGGANTRPPVIAKERETLKTLSYDCGNPVLICLRASARSAFLFTGSPRSFHSLAMTKGGNSPSTHHSCHSRVGGNRAWVVLIILFGEYFSVVFFYSLVIRDMNLIDPIPAFAGMTS